MIKTELALLQKPSLRLCSSDYYSSKPHEWEGYPCSWVTSSWCFGVSFCYSNTWRNLTSMFLETAPQEMILLRSKHLNILCTNRCDDIWLILPINHCITSPMINSISLTRRGLIRNRLLVARRVVCRISSIWCLWFVVRICVDRF
jgi:hypothetical protein